MERFKHIILIDYEYREEAPYGHVHPVCVVAKDLITGQEWREWLDDKDHQDTVLPTGSDVLYVSYSAPAEWSCYLALGIELPENILDLHAFHRISKNGWKLPKRGKKKNPKTGEAIVLKAKPEPYTCSLLSMMHENGLGQLAIDAERKTEWRELILRGGPYTEEERQGILDYCSWDVRDLELLMPKVTAMPDFNLEAQLFVGDFTRVLAWMDFNGVPVDVNLCERLTKNWGKILEKYARTKQAEHGYDVLRFDEDGPHLDEGRYAAYIEREGFAGSFPRSKVSGKFSKSTSKKRKEQPNLRTFAQDHEQFKGLSELVEFLTAYKHFVPPLGPDGRWRAPNIPWRQTTGRVTPSGTHLFRMHAYFRYLITPPPGRALAYCDLKAAEYGIGAALSGDKNMMGTYTDVLEGRAEKPYLVTGKKLGILPPEATSKHPLYKMCKAAELGMSYGQTVGGCALANNLPYDLAESFFEGHRALYPDYWRYTDWRIHEAYGAKFIRTPYGYQMSVHRNITKNQLQNWPMQATCAEIMRIATTRMLDMGLSICVTVHDAVLIEADDADIEAHAGIAQDCWRWASERVLGFRLDADVKIIHDGERYEDSDGTDDWNQLMQWLQEVEAENENESQPGVMSGAGQTRQLDEQPVGTTRKRRRA